MSQHRYRFSGLQAAILALVVLAVPVPGVAQFEFDAPTLSLVKADRTSIMLEVMAGASGAQEGFVVEWITRANYDALGGWPAPGHAAIGYCEFTGVPTLTVGPSPSYALGPNASIHVEIGDLFDETGMSTGYVYEMPAGVEYVFRAYAGYINLVESEYSNSLFASTSSVDPGCTRTQGYWKNHPEAWPVLSLTLGTVVYTQQELLDILNTPAAGNGLIFLAHQLIAAKLNVASGAATPGTLIADADALIGNLVVPPIGTGFLDPSVASDLTDDLDDFNNGLSGTPHCDSVPVEATPWGEVKSLFR